MNNTEQTSAQGSAVEWVRAFLDTDIPPTERDAYHANYDALRPLIKRYVRKLEELAQRCDAAESERECLAWDLSRMHDEVLRVTELLTAAKSEAASLRVSWQNAEAMGTEYREALDELLSCLKLMDGRQTGFSATALRVHVGHARTVLDKHQPQQP